MMLLRKAIQYILKALAGIPLSTWKMVFDAIVSAEVSLKSGPAREAWVRGVIDGLLPNAAPWAKNLLFGLALGYAAKAGEIHLSAAPVAPGAPKGTAPNE